jgi:hypothetical protein
MTAGKVLLAIGMHYWLLVARRAFFLLVACTMHEIRGRPFSELIAELASQCGV